MTPLPLRSRRWNVSMAYRNGGRTVRHFTWISPSPQTYEEIKMELQEFYAGWYLIEIIGYDEQTDKLFGG